MLIAGASGGPWFVALITYQIPLSYPSFGHWTPTTGITYYGSDSCQQMLSPTERLVGCCTNHVEEVSALSRNFHSNISTGSVFKGISKRTFNCRLFCGQVQGGKVGVKSACCKFNRHVETVLPWRSKFVHSGQGAMRQIHPHERLVPNVGTCD